MGIYRNEKILEERISGQNTVRAIADLAVENAKKDLLIQQLAQTIANLNIEIQQLKGGI